MLLIFHVAPYGLASAHIYMENGSTNCSYAILRNNQLLMSHVREVTAAAHDQQEIDTAGPAPASCQLKLVCYFAPVTMLFATHECVFTFLTDRTCLLRCSNQFEQIRSGRP